MMPRTARAPRAGWMALLGLAALALACGSRSELAGTYQAMEGGEPVSPETVIELKESGEGTWRVDFDEDGFTWFVRDGQIRLNTRQGGVLVGEIQNGHLVVHMPGGRKLRLERVE